MTNRSYAPRPFDVVEFETGATSTAVGMIRKVVDGVAEIGYSLPNRNGVGFLPATVARRSPARIVRLVARP